MFEQNSWLESHNTNTEFELGGGGDERDEIKHRTNRILLHEENKMHQSFRP